jgi:hypothetical protein
VKKKIICLAICLLLITISITIPISALTISNTKTKENTKKILPDTDVKNASIVVYRFDGDELDPVYRATVYIYRGPITIPNIAYTNENGYLTYQPTFYVGEDIKIGAYHEWFGGNSTIISIEEKDPDPIEIEIFLDPSKSIGNNLAIKSKIYQIIQDFKTLFETFSSII